MAVLTPDMVPTAVATGGSARVNVEVTPRFKPGDRIVVRNINPAGHTRLPRYIRGKHGVVHHDHGVFVFPDTNAHGGGPKPQHVYSVRFAARALWGSEVSSQDSVYIDLWDDYMDPA
jgi:nitrile hydratase subunit beta